ncbi:DUF5698 domain-containing protein [Aeoliella sp. ICT_H6.2]|uniref:DUF5698 domain-containing protein n=1 Tax=Aeoliella straminimaris TaxID=2954799 RepID=A0A9X2FE64_9BACT|nr:DUF5698 domain-containing protein [Aeoliella straminimaris]MCO6046563.1 DUF5698 domain-containing protein [Aeoliella straminimaris]
METMFSLPVWLVAILIFSLRIIDVSLGTCRTIAVVQGRIGLSVGLGFLEVLVWITTVANVIQHASSNAWLLLAYAAGFAAGNATGIYLERWLAMGMVILRLMSEGAGDELSDALGDKVTRVYEFDGSRNGQSVRLLYVPIQRRKAAALIAEAQRVDPHLFYAVDTLRDSNMLLPTPLPVPTGWRAAVKMK